MTVDAPTALAVPLEGLGAGGSLVGGKGAWLDRLLAEGFEVPPTAVVTTAAYRSVAGHPELSALLDELRATAPGEALDEEQRRVDDAFLAVPLPADVRVAISDAAAVARGSGGNLLAVRSSATAEDMAATSFAGQYRSFLEIGDDAEVERAVRLVWASLWHPAPRAYRRANGVSEDDLAMAAVVMPMVAARRAGVAFTVDPAGEPDVVRVEAVEGYAEGLVSGAVTPTVHLVPRADGAVGAMGDTEPDPLIREVADLALRVERAFGCPQDVEWAWDGQRTFLVQARPITSGPGRGDGFDTDLDPDRHYTTAGIAEMLPGVLPPLVWTVSSFTVEEGFRSLLDQLGALPDGLVGPGGMLARTRGRAVMDLTHLRQVAGALPGGSEGDVDRQYFGSTRGTAAPAAPAHESGRGMRSVAHDLRVVRARRQAVREAEVCEVAAEALLDSLEEPRARSDAALLALHRRVLDLTTRTVAAEMAVAAAATAAYRRLELLLLRHLDERQAATWAQELTAGAGRHAGWSEVRLAELGRHLDDPRVAAVVDEEPLWADAEARLDSTPEGRAALAGIRRSLREAGSMAVPGGRAWVEDPQPVWDLVRSAARDGDDAPAAAAAAAGGGRSDREVAADLLADELRALPGWRRHRLLRGGLVDARLSSLRRAADDAADLLAHREQTKADVLLLGGVLRSLHLEMGRRLVARGSLDAADDVDLVALSELAPSLSGRGPTRAALARRRHWMETCATAGPLPVRFQGTPVAEPQALPEGDVLVGWGAGPGVAHGPAQVVRSPSEGGFGQGSVLVARATDASWSPLFLRAAAIVVEEGGPLSHAAIVARELGIPAVLNVAGVVARLTAECAAAGAPVPVTVDGDQGVVVIAAPGHDDVAPVAAPDAIGNVEVS